jgi:hypothetical protein
VARVPNGRIAWALRLRAAGVPVERTLADVHALAGDDARRALVAELVAGLDEVAAGGSATRADAALAALRRR